MIGKKKFLILSLVFMASFTKITAMDKTTPKEKLYHEWETAHDQTKLLWEMWLQTPKLLDCSGKSQHCCSMKNPCNPMLKTSYENFSQLSEKEFLLRSRLANEYKVFPSISYGGYPHPVRETKKGTEA